MENEDSLEPSEHNELFEWALNVFENSVDNVVAGIG